MNTCLARVPFPQKFTRRKRDSYVQFHVRKSGKISDEGVPRVNNPLFSEGFPTTYSLTCPQFVSSWNFLELLFLSLEISLCCLLLLLFTSLNRYRSLFYSSSLSCVLFIIGTPCLLLSFSNCRTPMPFPKILEFWKLEFPFDLACPFLIAGIPFRLVPSFFNCCNSFSGAFFRFYCCNSFSGISFPYILTTFLLLSQFHLRRT